MDDFNRLLEAEIPRLRRYARALTRNASQADDLVQSCLARAVTKQDLWRPGTDLRAWLFTILHNYYVNDVRHSIRMGAQVSLETVAPMLPAPSNAAAALQLIDFERALGRLPWGVRQVILLVGLEGMRYEEVAEILGIPVGTVRSRLSRGRDRLRELMDMSGACRPDCAAADSSDVRRAEARKRSAGESGVGAACAHGRSRQRLSRSLWRDC